MASILYIGQNLVQGTGSPVILLRHLRRFAKDGWNVRVVADYGGDHTDCVAAGWTLIRLPHRRAWWPPYRRENAVLRWLRLRLLALEIAAAQVTPPDVILSYLASHTDFASAIAAHYARVSRRPLHVLVHDDATAFPWARATTATLRQRQAAALAPVEAAWFVSPELAESYPTVFGERRRVLLPLPEGDSVPAPWHTGRAALRVYYAGHVWPEQIPLLERCALAFEVVGAQLVVLAKSGPELTVAATRAPIEIIPPFSTNSAALEHLHQYATAALVSYADSAAAMPWSATSFPSKLIEYAHLGLPMALVAPADTAVQRWASRVAFKPTFRPNEMPALLEWLNGLRTKAGWTDAAATSLILARDAADPDRIHRELDAGLRIHVANSPRKQLPLSQQMSCDLR